jgi:hypothetical protein
VQQAECENRCYHDFLTTVAGEDIAHRQQTRLIMTRRPEREVRCQAAHACVNGQYAVDGSNKLSL